MPRSARKGKRLAEHYARRSARRRRGRVTVAAVIAEGVIDTGRVDDSSVLFIRTERGIRLFHVETLRQLDRAIVPVESAVRTRTGARRTPIRRRPMPAGGAG